MNGWGRYDVQRATFGRRSWWVVPLPGADKGNGGIQVPIILFLRILEIVVLGLVVAGEFKKKGRTPVELKMLPLKSQNFLPIEVGGGAGSVKVE